MIEGFTVVRRPILRTLAGVKRADYFCADDSNYTALIVASGSSRGRRKDNSPFYAAQIFCEKAVEAVSAFQDSNGKNVVKNALEWGNMNLVFYRESLNGMSREFRRNFAGCSAALAFVNPSRRNVTVSGAGESGIAILDREGKLKIGESYKTNGVARFSGDKIDCDLRTSTHGLDLGDTVLVYTDGLGQAMFENGNVRGEFADIVRGEMKGVQRFCKRRVESEGTLVYARI